MSDALQYLKGVGPSRARALAAEGITNASDLVHLVPRAYIARSTVGSLAALLERLRSPTLWTSGTAHDLVSVSSEVSIVATIVHVGERTFGRGRSMLQALITDESGGTASLVFWNAIPYFSKLLAGGGEFIVSGVPEFDGKFNQLKFTHPELERIASEDAERIAEGTVLATYSISQKMRTTGVTMRLLRSMIDQVLESTVASMDEVLPPRLVHDRNMYSRADAFRYLHQPPTIEHAERARRRLKYEELFFFQLTMAQRHSEHKRPQHGIPMAAKSPHARAIVNALPFQLTQAQRRVINEIVADMSSGMPMNRLLQGDVGSGKTIVALLCMLNVVDNGYQTVIMAPTELLAEQHLRTIRARLEGTDLRVEQLVGGQSRALRRETLEAIANGSVHIIVGTHALFEAQVQYKRLGLIVVDEQHRFGVAQRAQLQALGRESLHADTSTHDPAKDSSIPTQSHVLVMSATPIPRTLAMSVYGDLDVSVIDQLPENRKPIRTKVVFESQLDQAYEFIRSQVGQGRQVYIVYPLVEKSEKLELKSAVEHFEFLSTQVFPELRLGLLHGQLLGYEKDDVMQSFLQKELDVLVATTVIEVGVDVSNATVMLVENAERFGLSQLHQLRGRVGRGSEQSFCLLATKDHFKYQLRNKHQETDRAKSAVRLRTMEETTDGFKIAEVDLDLRGPGDVLGTRQSGLPEFEFANILTDAALMAEARKDAFDLISRDPTLNDSEHLPVIRHLHLLAASGVFHTVA